MAEIVGIHGVGKQYLGRHQLLRDWQPALTDGLERASGRRLSPPPLDLAYYGDHFLSPGATTGRKGATGQVSIDEADFEDAAQWLSEAVSADDIAAAEAETPKGYLRFPPYLQILLRAVDRRFGSAAALLYIGVLRQVRRFLTDPALSSTVLSRVAETVGPDCRVLVGHSLGSIVGYEFLRRNPGHSVELFVTLGSPLGLRMVRDRLTVETVPVASWVAIRDLRDPVACAGPLERWWPQIAAGPTTVVDNGTDAHAAERYLSRSNTGSWLLRALPQLATA